MSDRSSEGERDPESLAESHARRALRGDLRSFEWIAEELTGFLLWVAERVMGPVLRRQYEPEDLVHEAWVLVYPRLSEIRGEHGCLKALKKYLAKTIQRRAGELLERAMREEKLVRGRPKAAGDEGSSGFSQIPADVTTIVTRASRGQNRKRLLDVLHNLDELEQQIILLRVAYDLTFREIGDRVGMKENSVLKRWDRALDKLRELLPGSIFEDF